MRAIRSGGRLQREDGLEIQRPNSFEQFQPPPDCVRPTLSSRNSRYGVVNRALTYSGRTRLFEGGEWNDE
jgi:hypothetical protein